MLSVVEVQQDTAAAGAAGVPLIMGLDLHSLGVPAFLIKVIYSMRFELVFALSIVGLWMTGVLRRRKCMTPTKKKGYDTQGRSNHQKQPSGDRAFVKSQANYGPEYQQKQQQQQQSPSNASRTLGVQAFPQAAPSQLERRNVQQSNNGAFSSLEASATFPMPSRAQLMDSVSLFPQLQELCHGNAQRALEVYRAALSAGLDLSEVAEDRLEQLLMALVTAMIRMGQTDEVMRLIRDLHQRGLGVSQALCSSVVKLCTARHCFVECIAIYDLILKQGDSVKELADKSVWSCLLFCAVESRTYNRCHFFFEQLKKNGPPSQKDYWNMIRFGSVNGSWKMMLQFIQDMGAEGLKVDSIFYNTALATCVAADQVEEARRLLSEMDKVGGVSDVITYNTLMKGYTKRANMDECFALYELMVERGLSPSQVTYGIMLDGCINNNQVERAATVFDIMTKTNCPMNTVLFTTLIKGFAREGKVDDAMRVYRQMIDDKNVKPDLITFSILLKVNCDAGRLDSSLELLDAMLQINLQPDEVIFNNLLAGCAKHANSTLAKRLYSDMVATGIKPSNATFSIMIRLFAQCRLLEEAVEMLRNEPAKQKVEAEPRLYSQLIQSCIRARQGRRAVEVYELMLQHSGANAAMHNSILAMCAKLNMFDTAAELLELAAAKGGRVSGRDANLILVGARRKKKNSCAESVLASMKAMGLAPEPVSMLNLSDE